MHIWPLRGASNTLATLNGTLLEEYREDTDKSRVTGSTETEINQYKKISYRKQIVCQLHTQYVKGIYCNLVILKSGSGVVQGH